MKRILALCACMSAATSLSTRASHDHIAKVAFDGLECVANNGRYRVDGLDFTVEIATRDEQSAELAFYALPVTDRPARILLKADLIAQPLKFTPQGESQTYKPNTMTIDQYIAHLNRQEIPGFRSFIWNQDGSQKLLEKRQGPAVTIELRKTLRFLRQIDSHDSQRHVSEIFVEFGLEEDAVTSEFLVYSFKHKPVLTKVPNTWWLDEQKIFHTLTSVVFDTMPDSVRRFWAGAGGFQAQAAYAELWRDEADRGALLQNADQVDVGAGGLYFTMEAGNLLESKYVYVELNAPALIESSHRQYRMTTLRALQPKLFRAINAEGQGYQFEDLAQNGPVLHILQHTPYPLLLDSNASVTPLFQQGYYRLSSSSRDDSFINQTFTKFPAAPVAVEYRSRTQSAFSEADLTATLKSNTLVMSSLISCLSNLNMAYQLVLRPKVVIRTSSLPNEQAKSLVSDRVMPLIEASLQSEVNLVEPNVQQLLLTNPTLFEFMYPQVSSFPLLNLDADSLHFNDRVVTNDVLAWLWRAHFKTEQVRSINADKVYISGVGTDNWALRKLSELRGIQPSILRIGFEQLNPEDLQTLILIVRENPHLTELNLNGPISQVNVDFLKLVADHQGIQQFFFSPDDNYATFKNLNDAQLQQIFKRARYNDLSSVDLGNEILKQLWGSTLSTFLVNNAAKIREFTWTDASQRWWHWSDEIIGAIRQMSALRTIDARAADIGNTKLPVLARVLSSKESLHEVGMRLYYWYDGVRDALAAIPNARTIRLSCYDYPRWHKAELEKLVANKGADKPTVIAE